jgi:protein TonB
MTAAGPQPKRWPEAARWAVCLMLAVFFHAAGAAAMLARWNDNDDLLANAPVVMIELAPIAVAPETTPNDTPPDQVASRASEESEPEKPPEKTEITPEPAVQPDLSLLPPPKPIEKPKNKPPKKKKSLASAPTSADQKAERSAAPTPGASSQNPNALPNWRSQLVAQIERHKRFSGDDHGIVRVAFAVDRSGGIHNPRVVGSSGSSVLDRDAIGWLERSAPLPAPPPEVSGSMISISVPLRYNYR